MTNITQRQAFLQGFFKAAATQTQIPSVGAPNMAAPQPGQTVQPQPGQQGAPGQMGGQPQAQAKPPGNQLFYQLLAQFKQQNPMPQVPQAVHNMHMQPKQPGAGPMLG